MKDLPGEEWRDCEGYKGAYQVSNKSRVRSFKRSTVRILSPMLNRDGYFFIKFYGVNKRVWLVHRLVALAFIPNPAVCDVVNHIDCNKTNNDISNLEWTTIKKNVQHAYENGLTNLERRVGEGHGKCTITEEIAIGIAKGFKLKGATPTKLAKKYGTTAAVCRGIKTGGSWSLVTGIAKKRKNKYGAIKTTVDGIKFDSKAEAAYYVENKAIIVELQPKVYLTRARILMKLDFILNNGDYIDVKGMQTPVFAIKKRLWKHYATGTLVIVKKSGNRFKETERVEGKYEDN